MPDDLTDDIRQNAQGPAKAAGDAGSVEQHKLPDQIAGGQVPGLERRGQVEASWPGVQQARSTGSRLTVLKWLVQRLFSNQVARVNGVLRRRGRASSLRRGRDHEDNRRHWANADGLSANAANSPEVRRVLRNRSRYEVANNSYARGIVLTLAHDVIGTGPRLQMLTSDAEANRRIEQAVHAVVAAIDLPQKLRTMRVCAQPRMANLSPS